MSYLQRLPGNATVKDIYAAFPDVCAPLGLVTERIMRGPAPFSQAQRELIAAYVSGLNACNYCYGVHSAVAEACGVDEDILPVLLDDPGQAPIDDKMRPILSFARKLTLESSRISEEDVQPIYEAGWEDDAVFFTVSVTALFNFYNRFTEGFGLDAPPGHNERASIQLSTEGYDLLGT